MRDISSKNKQMELGIQEREEEKKDVYYKEYAESWKELSSSLANFMLSQQNGGSNTVTISDVQNFLENPAENMKEIRQASSYLINKHGILRDSTRMVKSLPTLKYGLNWTLPESANIGEYEREANQLLDDINVVDVVRDGLLEVAETGTVVMCLRSKKYVQFLNIDDLKVDTMRDGKWVVEYDLGRLDDIDDEDERKMIIEALPDEITESAYKRYQNSGDDKDRYVEISNCEIVNLDAKRNSPYGFPMTMGAWLPILQKEVIDQVERSVSDRLVKQILILSAGHMDKDKTKPAPPELIDFYFKKVDDLIKKKEKTNYSQNGASSSGTGVIAFPDMFSLDALEVDTTFFTKDLYDKIEGDIYANLGISKALGYGEGGNYSSATVNSEKFFSIVFSLVGQFETVINAFLQTLFPDDVKCKIKFDRATVMDKQRDIDNYKEVYMQTSLITPWLEATTEMSIEDIAKQREYEKSLGIEDLFFPAQSAHTTSGSDVKDDKTKEEIDDEDIDNENTAKTRSNDGNGNPSPSDE